MQQNRKLYIGLGVAIAAIALGYLLYVSVQPLPGEKQTDLGRGHVAIGTVVKYNSNPPTSGPHYEDWTKAGIYSDVKDDRNLVHSLEHGYIIISYNCDFAKKGLIPQAYAQEATQSAEASSSAVVLSDKFKSSDCQDTVKKLSEIYDKKGKSKMIIVPRPELDAYVALTAWNYLMKFDDPNFLDNSDNKKKVDNFINAHRNNGPEKTME